MIRTKYWLSGPSLLGVMLQCYIMSGLSFNLHSIILTTFEASPSERSKIQQSTAKGICPCFQNVY